MILKKYKYLICAFVMIIMTLLGSLSVAADETPPQPLNPPKVTGIALKQMPIRTLYLVGEKLDMSGALLELTYDKGDSGECAVKLDWCTGFDSSKAGTKTVTITYPDTNCKTTLNVEVVSEKSIEIVKPSKLAYFVGDKEDRTGLSVSVVYSNGKSESLDEDDYTVSGFSSNTIGEKTVTVKYKNLSATYKVTVVEPALLSIKIEKKPNKLSYYIGEKLTVSGIKVTASYEDGKTADVSSKIDVSGDISTSGVKKITVSYSERDYIKTATFNVTVTDVEIKSIRIVSYPKKTEYKENEIFDPTGVSIKVTYNNGKTETVSGESIQYTGFETKTIGTKTITLHYGGKKLEFNVEVKVSDLHVHKEGTFEIVFAPTCTANGEQATTCTVCFKTVTVRPIPALGHGQESDPVLTKAPTCTEPGQTSTKCMVCGDTVTVSDIFPLGHKESEPELILAPNCTETGVSKTHCTVCNDEVTVTYHDALGHSFGIWTVISEPTGDTEGKEERVCSVCTFTESRAMKRLEKVTVSGNSAASLNSAEYFPYGTVFTANMLTSILTSEEISLLVPAGNYVVLEVFEYAFTNINGEKFLPKGEISYSVKYSLPVGEYESFLVFDKDMGSYIPLAGTDSFSFTAERAGRFVLVGEKLPEPSVTEDPNVSGENTEDTNAEIPVSASPVRAATAVILALTVAAVLLFIIMGILVYSYAFKRY